MYSLRLAFLTNLSVLVENFTLSDMVVPRYLYSDTCCTTVSLIEIGIGVGLSLVFENTTSLILVMLRIRSWSAHQVWIEFIAGGLAQLG